MNSLSQITDNVKNIRNESDIDRTLELSEKLFVPLLTYGEYKLLKNEINEEDLDNNRSLYHDYRDMSRNRRRFSRTNQLSEITRRVSNLIEVQPEDDFM